MKKLAAIAAIPLFAGYLMAQAPQTSQTTTTTTTTTYNGTLLDAGCYKTHTQKTESSSDVSGSTTTETKSVATNCPATTETTSFGLMTPEGKYVAFDDAGNQRVVQVVKTNKDWTTAFTEHKPVRVRVIGMPNGDTIVVKEIK